MKEFKSVKAHYEALINEEKHEPSKIDRIQSLAQEIVETPSQLETDILVLVQDMVNVVQREEESASERYERFKKTRVGQILQQAKFDTEVGLLHIKRTKSAPDAMSLIIQFKRPNGLSVVFEAHDALERDFSETLKHFQALSNEGTLVDYCIQAYESVVML